MYDINCKFDESAIIKLKNCPTSALTTISTNAENGAAWTRSTTLIADETSFEMLDDLTTDVSCTERASIRSSRKDSGGLWTDQIGSSISELGFSTRFDD